MTPIPNTFQTPNIYVDKLMSLLDNDELRVHIFAVRHIMGWQDKIGSRIGVISLTMFEKGFTTKEGVKFDGCGLTRPAIKDALDRLVKFRVMDKLRLTDKGQEWHLGEDIDWSGLTGRKSQSLKTGRDKTAKATKASADKRRKNGDTGTSHVPPPSQYVPRTTDGTSHVPGAGTSHVLNQTHSSNPLSNPQKNPPTPTKQNGGKPLQKMTEAQAMIAAWQIAQKRDANANGDLENKAFQKLANELIQEGLTPEDVTRYVAHNYAIGLQSIGFHNVRKSLQTWILNNPIRVRADSSRDAFDDAALARSRQARKKHPELAEEWGEDEIIPQHLIEHFDLKKQPFPLPEGVTEEMIEALVKTHRYEEPPDPLSRRF